MLVVRLYFNPKLGMTISVSCCQTPESTPAVWVMVTRAMLARQVFQAWSQTMNMPLMVLVDSRQPEARTNCFSWQTDWSSLPLSFIGLRR
jgi:hypothetical protein